MKLFSYRLFVALAMLCLVWAGLLSAGEPDIRFEAFNKKAFDEIFTRADRLGDQVQWRQAVESGKQSLRAVWEADALRRIEDAIQGLPANQQPGVRRHLETEMAVARDRWEQEADSAISRRKLAWLASRTANPDSRLDSARLRSELEKISQQYQDHTRDLDEDMPLWDQEARQFRHAEREALQTGISNQLFGATLPQGLSAEELARYHDLLRDRCGALVHDWDLSADRLLAKERSLFVSRETDRRRRLRYQERVNSIVGRLEAVQTLPLPFVADQINTLQATLSNVFFGEQADFKDPELLSLYDSFLQATELKVEAFTNGVQTWQQAVADCVASNQAWFTAATNIFHQNSLQWQAGYSNLQWQMGQWSNQLELQVAQGTQAWNSALQELQHNLEAATNLLDDHVQQQLQAWNGYAGQLGGLFQQATAMLPVAEKNRDWYKAKWDPVAATHASCESSFASVLPKHMWYLFDDFSSLYNIFGSRAYTICYEDNRHNRYQEYKVYDFYKTEYDRWQRISSDLSTLVSESMEKLHNGDLYAGEGPSLFDNNDGSYLYGDTELALTMAERDLEYWRKRLEIATAVYSYATNEARPPDAELQANLATASNLLWDAQSASTSAESNLAACKNQLSAARSALDLQVIVVSNARSAVDTARATYQQHLTNLRYHENLGDSGTVKQIRESSAFINARSALSTAEGELAAAEASFRNRSADVDAARTASLNAQVALTNAEATCLAAKQDFDSAAAVYDYALLLGKYEVTDSQGLNPASISLQNSLLSIPDQHDLTNAAAVDLWTLMQQAATPRTWAEQHYRTVLAQYQAADSACQTAFAAWNNRDAFKNLPGYQDYLTQQANYKQDLLTWLKWQQAMQKLNETVETRAAELGKEQRELSAAGSVLFPINPTHQNDQESLIIEIGKGKINKSTLDSWLYSSFYKYADELLCSPYEVPYYKPSTEGVPVKSTWSIVWNEAANARSNPVLYLDYFRKAVQGDASFSSDLFKTFVDQFQKYHLFKTIFDEYDSYYHGLPDTISELGLFGIFRYQIDNPEKGKAYWIWNGARQFKDAFYNGYYNIDSDDVWDYFLEANGHAHHILTKSPNGGSYWKVINALGDIRTEYSQAKQKLDAVNCFTAIQMDSSFAQQVRAGTAGDGQQLQNLMDGVYNTLSSGVLALSAQDLGALQGAEGRSLLLNILNQNKDLVENSTRSDVFGRATGEYSIDLRKLLPKLIEHFAGRKNDTLAGMQSNAMALGLDQRTLLMDQEALLYDLAQNNNLATFATSPAGYSAVAHEILGVASQAMHIAKAQEQALQQQRWSHKQQAVVQDASRWEGMARGVHSHGLDEWNQVFGEYEGLWYGWEQQVLATINNGLARGQAVLANLQQQAGSWKSSTAASNVAFISDWRSLLLMEQERVAREAARKQQATSSNARAGYRDAVEIRRQEAEQQQQQIARQRLRARLLAASDKSVLEQEIRKSQTLIRNAVQALFAKLPAELEIPSVDIARLTADLCRQQRISLLSEDFLSRADMADTRLNLSEVSSFQGAARGQLQQAQSLVDEFAEASRKLQALQLFDSLDETLDQMIASYQKLIEKADQGMANSLSRTLQQNGFRLSGDQWQRRAVVDCTIWGKEYATQKVPGYQSFAYAPFRKEMNASGRSLSVLTIKDMSAAELQAMVDGKRAAIEQQYTKLMAEDSPENPQDPASFQYHCGTQPTVNDKGEVTGGSGQMKRVIGPMLAANIQKQRGEAKAALPFWKQSLWDSDHDNDGKADGFLGEVSLFSVAKIGISVAGGPWASLALDAVDTGYSVACGDMKLGDGIMNLAKGAAGNLVGGAANFVGNSAGNLVNSLGLGSVTASVVSSVASSYASSYANALVQSIDIKNGDFSKLHFNTDKWSSMTSGSGFANSALMAGTTSFVNSTIMAAGGASYHNGGMGHYDRTGRSLAYGSRLATHTRAFASTVSGLAGQAMNYALNGEVSLNLLNTRDIAALFGGGPAMHQLAPGEQDAIGGTGNRDQYVANHAPRSADNLHHQGILSFTLGKNGAQMGIDNKGLDISLAAVNQLAVSVGYMTHDLARDQEAQFILANAGSKAGQARMTYANWGLLSKNRLASQISRDIISGAKTMSFDLTKEGHLGHADAAGNRIQMSQDAMDISESTLSKAGFFTSVMAREGFLVNANNALGVADQDRLEDPLAQALTRTAFRVQSSVINDISRNMGVTWGGSYGEHAADVQYAALTGDMSMYAMTGRDYWYKVKAGDGMAAIWSREQATGKTKGTYAQYVQENISRGKITSPGRIAAGQDLWIPGKEDSPLGWAWTKVDEYRRKKEEHTQAIEDNYDLEYRMTASMLERMGDKDLAEKVRQCGSDYKETRRLHAAVQEHRPGFFDPFGDHFGHYFADIAMDSYATSDEQGRKDTREYLGRMYKGYEGREWERPGEYFHQKDNKEAPDSTCGLTSLSMALTILKPELTDRDGRLPDEVIDVMKKKGMRIDYGNRGNLVKVGLEYLGEDWKAVKFGGNKLWDTMKEQGRIGNPVVLHTDATSHGHIIVQKKWDFSKNGMVAWDPYGDKSKPGGYWNRQGKNAFYNYEFLKNSIKPFAGFYFKKR